MNVNLVQNVSLTIGVAFVENMVTELITAEKPLGMEEITLVVQPQVGHPPPRVKVMIENDLIPQYIWSENEFVMVLAATFSSSSTQSFICILMEVLFNL